MKTNNCVQIWIEPVFNKIDKRDSRNILNYVKNSKEALNARNEEVVCYRVGEFVTTSYQKAVIEQNRTLKPLEKITKEQIRLYNESRKYDI